MHIAFSLRHLPLTQMFQIGTFAICHDELSQNLRQLEQSYHDSLQTEKHQSS